MVKFNNFIDDQAEVELADGTKLRIPKAVIPKGTKPGGDFQISPPQRRKAQAAGSVRSKQAFQFFMDRGWGPTASAAIVGNLMQESGMGLSTKAVGDKGTAFGIGQWRGDRLANLRRRGGANWQDFETQLDFVDWELRNTEKAAGNKLANAQDLREATFAMAGFERPAGWKGFGGNPEEIHGWSNRFKFAERVLGGGGAAMASTPETMGGGSGVSPNDSMRSRLASLIKGKPRAEAKPRSKGQVLQDVIAGGLMGLSDQPEAEIPESTFASPGEFGQISQQMAQSGPLPSLEESAQRFRDLL